MKEIEVQGIYIISDLTNGKSYVGSTKSLKRRIKEHYRDLKSGKHYNQYLQRSFNNGHKFNLNIFPLNDDEDRIAIEQAILDSEKPTGCLYNNSGIAGYPEVTPEVRAKMVANAKARGMPQAVIEAARIANTGRIHTDEQKAITRKLSTERMLDPARRQAVSDFHTGRKHTPESIALMKEKTVGRTFTPQAIEARKCVMLGRIHSSEEKAKRIASNTGRIRTGEALNNIKTAGIARRKIVMVDGKVYGDVNETAKAFDITPSNVVKRVNKTLAKYVGWVYSQPVLTPG